MLHLEDAKSSKNLERMPFHARGCAPARGRLSRNPLFRSNRRLAIVDVDVNVDVHVDGQAYDNQLTAKYSAGCAPTMKHFRPRPRRCK